MGTRAFKSLCKSKPTFQRLFIFLPFLRFLLFFLKNIFLHISFRGGGGRDTLGWGKRQKKLIFMQSIFLYKVWKTFGCYWSVLFTRFWLSNANFCTDPFDKIKKCFLSRTCSVFFLPEPIFCAGKKTWENSLEGDGIFRIKYFHQGFILLLVWIFFPRSFSLRFLCFSEVFLKYR